MSSQFFFHDDELELCHNVTNDMHDGIVEVHRVPSADDRSATCIGLISEYVELTNDIINGWNQVTSCESESVILSDDFLGGRRVSSGLRANYETASEKCNQVLFPDTDIAFVENWTSDVTLNKPKLENFLTTGVVFNMENNTDIENRYKKSVYPKLMDRSLTDVSDVACDSSCSQKISMIRMCDSQESESQLEAEDHTYCMSSQLPQASSIESSGFNVIESATNIESESVGSTKDQCIAQDSISCATSIESIVKIDTSNISTKDLDVIDIDALQDDKMPAEMEAVNNGRLNIVTSTPVASLPISRTYCFCPHGYSSCSEGHYHCRQCGESFKYISLITRHEKLHAELKVLIPVSDDSISTARTLSKGEKLSPCHCSNGVLVMSNEESLAHFHCKECSYSSRHRHHVLRHSLTHSKKAPASSTKTKRVKQVVDASSSFRQSPVPQSPNVVTRRSFQRSVNSESLCSTDAQAQDMAVKTEDGLLKLCKCSIGFQKHLGSHFHCRICDITSRYSYKILQHEESVHNSMKDQLSHGASDRAGGSNSNVENDRSKKLKYEETSKEVPDPCASLVGNDLNNEAYSVRSTTRSHAALRHHKSALNTSATQCSCDKSKFKSIHFHCPLCDKVMFHKKNIIRHVNAVHCEDKRPLRPSVLKATKRVRSKRMSLVVSRFGFGKSFRVKDSSPTSVSQEISTVEMKMEELKSVEWKPPKKLGRFLLEHLLNDMPPSMDGVKVKADTADVKPNLCLEPCRCSAAIHSNSGSKAEEHFHCLHCEFISPLESVVGRHIIDEHETTSRPTARKSTTVRQKKRRSSENMDIVDIDRSSPSGGDLPLGNISVAKKTKRDSMETSFYQSEDASRKSEGGNEMSNWGGSASIEGESQPDMGVSSNRNKTMVAEGDVKNHDSLSMCKLKRGVRADRDKKMVHKVTICLDGVERTEKVASNSGLMILPYGKNRKGKKISCHICKQRFVRAHSCRNHLACSHDILLPGLWLFQCLPCRYSTTYQYLFASHTFSLSHLSAIDSLTSQRSSPADVKPVVDVNSPSGDRSAKSSDRQKMLRLNRVKWFYSGIPNTLTSRQVIGAVQFVREDRRLVWNEVEHVCSVHCTGKEITSVFLEPRCSLNVKPVSVEILEELNKESREKLLKAHRVVTARKSTVHRPKMNFDKEPALSIIDVDRTSLVDAVRKKIPIEHRVVTARKSTVQRPKKKFDKEPALSIIDVDRTSSVDVVREEIPKEHRVVTARKSTVQRPKTKFDKEPTLSIIDVDRTSLVDAVREEIPKEHRVVTARKSTVQRPKTKFDKEPAFSIIDVDRTSSVDAVREGAIDVEECADGESTSIHILSVSGSERMDGSQKTNIDAEHLLDVIMVDDDDSCDADVTMLTSVPPMGSAVSSGIGQQHPSMTSFGVPIMSYLLQSLMNLDSSIGPGNSPMSTPTPQSSAGEKPSQRPTSLNEPSVPAASSQPVSTSPAPVASTSLDQFSPDDLWSELCRRGNLRSCPCGVSFDDVALYLLHRSCHAPDAPLRCAFCAHNASSSYDFHGHLLDHRK